MKGFSVLLTLACAFAVTLSTSFISRADDSGRVQPDRKASNAHTALNESNADLVRDELVEALNEKRRQAGAKPLENLGAIQADAQHQCETLASRDSEGPAQPERPDRAPAHLSDHPSAYPLDSVRDRLREAGVCARHRCATTGQFQIRRIIPGSNRANSAVMVSELVGNYLDDEKQQSSYALSPRLQAVGMAICRAKEGRFKGSFYSVAVTTSLD